MPSLVGSQMCIRDRLMVDEVRRQFRTIPGILKGEAIPDYATCIDISTRNALKEMILPASSASLCRFLWDGCSVTGRLVHSSSEQYSARPCWGHSSTTQAQHSTTQRNSSKTLDARAPSNIRRPSLRTPSATTQRRCRTCPADLHEADRHGCPAHRRHQTAVLAQTQHYHQDEAGPHHDSRLLHESSLFWYSIAMS